MTDNPLVSICTLTFNHAKFIRHCLDGFLMQERNFGIEILIHDDASTDGTVEILREYEAKYPNLIFPLYETENQYTRGGAGKMDLFNYNRAKGKYIAYCEGDDYWTDPNKLKRQVEFMEANDWCTVCFTRWREYFVDKKTYGNDTCDELFTDECDGVVLTPSLYFKRCYTATLTMLFRFSCYEDEWRNHYSYYRDSHEMYHLLKKGNGYIMNFIGGQYNRHPGGISSGISLKDSCQLELNIARELYAYNNNKDTKMNLINILQWNINSSNKIGANVFSLSLKRLALDKNIIKFIKNILKNMPKKNNKFYIDITRRIKRAIFCRTRQFFKKKIERFNTTEFYKNPEKFEKIWYASQYGYKPNLKKPADINQLLLKLNIESFQDKRLHEIRVRCADKYLVRDYVESKGLGHILIPLLGVYDNIDDVIWGDLPDQFVIKTNFACGQNYICKDKKRCNIEVIKTQFRNWMNISDFGLSTGEWHYCEILHKIIIEQYLKSPETGSITDYKFQCFNGKVYGCLVVTDRTIQGANFSHYNKEWELTSGIKPEFNKKNKLVPKPDTLDKMIEIAEVLSSGIPYCRIDLYSIGNDIFFGETTFTPAANIMGYYEEWILKDMLSFYQSTEKTSMSAISGI